MSMEVHADLRMALRSIVAEHQAASRIETSHDAHFAGLGTSPRLPCAPSTSSLFETLPLHGGRNSAESSGSQLSSARRSGSSPRSAAPVDVQRGRTTPRGSASQTGRSGSWASSTRSGSTSLYLPDSRRLEFNAEKWGVQKAADRRVPGRRPVYAAVNSKPKPLRGGGAGSRPGSRAGSCPASPRREGLDLECQSPRMRPPLMHSSTPQLVLHQPEQGRPTVCSIATPTSSIARSPRSCFDESHINLRDNASDTAILHQHLQETRERLAVVEAEQRRLEHTSLGALVKVACAAQNLPYNCPPSPWSHETLHADAQFPSRPLVPSGDNELSCQAVTPRTTSPRTRLLGTTSSGATPRALSPPCSVASSTGSRVRLEHENRWLKSAVERARLKNGELDTRREAIEARNRLLAEGNHRAMQTMLARDDVLESHHEALGPEQEVNDIAKHIREMQASRDAAEARCSLLITENNNLKSFAEERSTDSKVRVERSDSDHAAQSSQERNVESKANPEGLQQAQEALRNLLDTKAAVEQRLGNLIERRQGLKVKLECTS